MDRPRLGASHESVCRTEEHLSALQGWLATFYDLAAVGSEERLKALIPSDDSAIHSREDPDWR